MTLKEIKNKLGVQELSLYRSTGAEGEEQPWLRHWEDDIRMSVSIHEDLAKELAQDKQGKTNSLGLQYEARTSLAGGKYDSYRIVKYAEEAEMVL